MSGAFHENGFRRSILYSDTILLNFAELLHVTLQAVFSTSSETSRGFMLANRLSSHAVRLLKSARLVFEHCEAKKDHSQRWTISATPTKNLTQNHENLSTIERPLDANLHNKDDEDDLARLGRSAAFLKILPFSTDKALFRHWITEAFVLGYGYASASSFLNQ